MTEKQFRDKQTVERRRSIESWAEMVGAMMQSAGLPKNVVKLEIQFQFIYDDLCSASLSMSAAPVLQEGAR